MSQATLAGQSKISASWLSKIERGEVDPTWATVARLSSELGVPMEVLVKTADRLEEEPGSPS
jgi:transcriptional regulator with XRE-family HTH domain